MREPVDEDIRNVLAELSFIYAVRRARQELVRQFRPFSDSRDIVFNDLVGDAFVKFRLDYKGVARKVM